MQSKETHIRRGKFFSPAGTSWLCRHDTRANVNSLSELARRLRRGSLKCFVWQHQMHTREVFVSISNSPNFVPRLFGDRHPDETNALVFDILLEILKINYYCLMLLISIPKGSVRWVQTLNWLQIHSFLVLFSFHAAPLPSRVDHAVVYRYDR